MMQKKDYLYDAFISHAVEDKLAIANDLCKRLEQTGLKIWYSGIELNMGDDISDTIMQGLYLSRYGIVILSRNYLSKNWTMKELHILMSKERGGKKVILPILYDVTVQDLIDKDIDLASRFAIKAEIGMDAIVAKLLTEITKGKTTEKREQINQRKNRLLLTASITTMLLIATYSGIQVYNAQLQRYKIEHTIQGHIADFVTKEIQSQRIDSLKVKGVKVTADVIQRTFEEFSKIKSYYRNEYVLVTRDTTIRFKKNVEPTLNIEMNKLTPSNSYAMLDPIFYLLSDTIKNGVRQVQYHVENSQPLTFKKEELDPGQEGVRKIKVFYQNNIRSIVVTLTFPEGKEVRRHNVIINGFRPEETYVFNKKGKQWRLLSIQ